MTANRAPFVLVGLLWVALAINYVDRQMVYSIFPALKDHLGFTDARLGLVGSVFTWIYALGQPAAGLLADRFRRDRLIVLSLVLWSLSTIGGGLSSSIGAFLGWRALLAVTETLYYPAAAGLLAAAHSDATRSRALGIHQSAQLAGIVFGGWYGGWMADNISWRSGFAVIGLIGLLYSMFLLRTLPPSPPPARRDAARLADGLRLFNSRCFLALAFAFFLFCAMLWTFYAWLPSFLYERYHLSMTESGFNATIFVQASCGLGIVAGGYFADRLSRKTPAARFYIAALGVLASAPFGYLTFATGSLNLARLFSAGYGVCSGLMIANVFAASYDVISRRHFGLGAGLLNMTGGISAAIMIYLAGALKSTIGFAGLLQWVAVLCAAAALLLAYTASRRLAAERVADS